MYTLFFQSFWLIVGRFKAVLRCVFRNLLDPINLKFVNESDSEILRLQKEPQDGYTNESKATTQACDNL